MPARLIVNADDFGLTPGINRAVAELYAAGALSSATLMANGPAFDDAVATATQHPGLGIGCHVVFTDGVPVSPPRSIPSLLASDGRNFRSSLVGFAAAVLSGLVDHNELAREATGQIQRLQAAGLTVTHVDTHKHTHVFPSVARALLQAAELTGVRAVRNPFEQPWTLGLGHGEKTRTLEVRLVRVLKHRFLSIPSLTSGAILTSDGTVGISATGNLDEAALAQILHVLPEGTWELVCHPGYNDADLDRVQTRLRDAREIERRALLALLSHEARNRHFTLGESRQPAGKFELIHYGQLDTPHLCSSSDIPQTRHD